MRKNQKGFTLLEMGVVMVIIALLAGSIFAGQTLVEAAKIKATVSQIEEFQSSFNVFIDQFSAYPGDFSRASTFIGTGVPDGNGDTKIGWTDTGSGGELEGPLAWYHMQQAGLVQGGFGSGLTSPNAIPSDKIPVSKIGGDGGGYHMNYDNGTTPALAGSTALENYLGLGLYEGSGINDGDLLSPRQAHDIDRKLDDGLPDSGVIRGSGTSGSGCYTGSAYSLLTDSVKCWIGYKLD
jgi:prepilin-type N-terminal cleavage/methylation domain-containing protein